MVLTFQSWTSFSVTPTKSWVGFLDGTVHCDLGVGTCGLDGWRRVEGGSVVLLPMFLMAAFQIWKYILTGADLLGHSGENDCFAVGA